MTKRTRTALDWLAGGHGGGLIMKDGEIDETSVRDAIGRFGPDAPDQNQSPVVWHPNYAPTPNWRGKSKEQCVPNTWMGDYPADKVEDVRRGEVVLRCPEKEARGARASGSMKGRATTYMNNLEYGPTYIYGGIAGNPSRSKGNGGLNGNRHGSADGTAEYGGGSLTTLHNSPIPAYSGQQLYCSEVPLVEKDANGKVLGNYFRYTFYPWVNGHQPKLLPTVIALNFENIEQLQNGPLWELTDLMHEMLKPSKVSANAESIRAFCKEHIIKSERANGFHVIPAIGPWLRVSVLYDGLLTACFAEHGREKNNLHVAYQNAARALYAQLAQTIQEFYIEEKRKLCLKYGGEGRTLAMKHIARIPLDLHNKLLLDKADPESGDNELELKPEFHKALRMLRRADCIKTTLHNQLSSWLKNHWMGTVTSPVTQPGDQIKFISRA